MTCASGSSWRCFADDFKKEERKGRVGKTKLMGEKERDINGQTETRQRKDGERHMADRREREGWRDTWLTGEKERDEERV